MESPRHRLLALLVEAQDVADSVGAVDVVIELRELIADVEDNLDDE